MKSTASILSVFIVVMKWVYSVDLNDSFSESWQKILLVIDSQWPVPVLGSV